MEGRGLRSGLRSTVASFSFFPPSAEDQTQGLFMLSSCAHPQPLFLSSHWSGARHGTLSCAFPGRRACVPPRAHKSPTVVLRAAHHFPQSTPHCPTAPLPHSPRDAPSGSVWIAHTFQPPAPFVYPIRQSMNVMKGLPEHVRPVGIQDLELSTPCGLTAL